MCLFCAGGVKASKINGCTREVLLSRESEHSLRLYSVVKWEDQTKISIVKEKNKDLLK